MILAESGRSSAGGARGGLGICTIGLCVARRQALFRRRRGGGRTLRRSIELYCNYPISHLYLAAALQLLGRTDEAKKEASASAQSEIHAPALPRRRTERQPHLPEAARAIIEALRAAGIPGSARFCSAPERSPRRRWSICGDRRRPVAGWCCVVIRSRSSSG